VGVENFCTKLPEGTPLLQIWSNKSFAVCGSDVVLTLYGDEKKKYASIAIGNSMSSITLQPLPRRRDVCIVYVLPQSPQTTLGLLRCVSKSSPFYFCDNCPNCNNIWQKHSSGNFEQTGICQFLTHRKMTPNCKITMSHFRQIKF